MEAKIFHGDIVADDIANGLKGHFDRGNYRVQCYKKDSCIVIQIATYIKSSSGGQTSLTITVTQIEDGVSVQLGKQAIFGVAASIGKTALTLMRNPIRLLTRLDDLAQDIESIQLSEEVWRVIEEIVALKKSSYELSERLRKITCLFCNTANPMGASRCLACGAPLGDVQPRTCSKCGFVIIGQDRNCPNCKSLL